MLLRAVRYVMPVEKNDGFLVLCAVRYVMSVYPNFFIIPPFHINITYSNVYI